MLRIIGAAGRQPRLHRRADAPDRGADRAAARVGRDRKHLRRSPARPERQQRLHGAVAGAVGRARAHPAADRRRHHRAHCRQVPGVRAFAVQPNSLGIRGAGNGLQFALVGNRLCRARRRRRQDAGRDGEGPALPTAAPVDYETTQPQLFVTIDRERASDLGIDINGPVAGAAGDARRPRASATSSSSDRSYRREAGLDDQPDQRSDRSREHLPQDRRRHASCRCRPSPR